MYDFQLNRYYNYSSEGRMWCISTDGVSSYDGELYGALYKLEMNFDPLFQIIVDVGMIDYRGVKLSILELPGSNDSLTFFCGYAKEFGVNETIVLM
jgi:hypothetical protein